jgi:Flavodoxin
MTGTRALVVYESMFGNTADVAREVATGLASRCPVDLMEVHDAPAPPDETYELVVVGGPTHGFSMSRPSTREDARRQGADGPADRGLREWMDELVAGRHHPRLAAFDTRVTKVRHLPGSAAKRAGRLGRRLGYAAACPPESFYVEDVSGPLADGERERARAWGAHLADLRR